MKNTRLFVLTFMASMWGLALCASYTLRNVEGKLELSMPYGITIIHEPVLIEIIAHPAFERLKELNQYGVMQYMGVPAYVYTRYEHSLGVFLLLRMFGADLDEQLAGLLHDASHTAFSHVGDLVFNHSLALKSHQDNIHSWYLAQSGLADVLYKYGFDTVCTAHKEEWFMLSQPSSCLCADRIEYNIKGALLEGMITEQDVQMLLSHMRYENDHWYFTCPHAARLFGTISLALTEHIWCTDWNLFIYHQAAQAIQRAMSLGLVSENDMHFSTDERVWQMLCASDDALIQDCLACIKCPTLHFKQGSDDDFDFYMSNRFRGIDPLVMLDDSGMQRLSSIDSAFNAEYQRVAALADAGCYLKRIRARRDIE